LAGKIVVKNGEHLSSKYWHSKDAVCKLPNLAIHLQSATEREAFKPNKESNTKPVLATSVID
jgi:aspartyl aminopeptidase